MLVSKTWQNYQQTITGAILERRIQKLLTSHEAQKQFLYHRKLIYLIAELYDNMDPAVVESIAMIHFLQFQYLYFMVNYKALPMTINNTTEARKVLWSIEEKTKEIASYFTAKRSVVDRLLADSYTFLNDHIDNYETACSLKVEIDKELYEELVKPFSVVFNLPVEVFSSISDEGIEKGNLTAGLENYFLGKKLISDIIDFKYDVAGDSWNHVQYSFNKRMKREGIAIDQMDAKKKVKYFFVSGVATELYGDAIKYFEKSVNCWDMLPSDNLAKFPQQDIKQIGQIILTIDQLLEKAANKVGTFIS